MRSSSSVGLGLSVVFGCLLLALIAELYYLLWCKKRVTNTDFLYMFCWKKPSSLISTGLIKDTQVHEPQASPSSSSWVRPLDQDYDDMSVETELLRLHNLCGPGPPRFLFTIKEETKEDLESEDRSKRGSRGRSLSSEVVFSVETPFFTPLASPAYFTPPLTPRDSTYRPFSPLSHSSSDAEFNRIRASPPPQFKFLKGTEDKHERSKAVERFGVADSVKKGDEIGSFITLVVSK